jgi:anthranilate synthase component 1
VTERLVIERYSHVMHLVSNVRGDLGRGLRLLRCLPRDLPAGTLSGAPKNRAMEIIEELEPIRRGVYGRRRRLLRLLRQHGHRDRDPHDGDRLAA